MFLFKKKKKAKYYFQYKKKINFQAKFTKWVQSFHPMQSIKATKTHVVTECEWIKKEKKEY